MPFQALDLLSRIIHYNLLSLHSSLHCKYVIFIFCFYRVCKYICIFYYCIAYLLFKVSYRNFSTYSRSIRTLPRWGEHILLDHQQIQVILQFLSVLFLGLQKNHTVILWKRISQIITCHTKWCTNRKELRNRWCASVFNSQFVVYIQLYTSKSFACQSIDFLMAYSLFNK